MTTRLRPHPSLAARFWRDRRGVSAIEFAIIAPVMIAMYFGVGELSGGMMSERRASDVASTIGDLVAQCGRINDTDLTDIWGAAATIMRPFPTTTLKMRLTSVVGDSGGSPSIASSVGGWSESQNWSDATSVSQLGLPAGMITLSGESVIVAEAQYTYNSPVNYVTKNGLVFNEKFFLKPRKTGSVKYKATTVAADSCAA
jgi:Flp pilus assembly protein TadG